MCGLTRIGLLAGTFSGNTHTNCLTYICINIGFTLDGERSTRNPNAAVDQPANKADYNSST